MKKLASARAAILASPLKIDAAQLLTFAEKGTVHSVRGEGRPGYMIDYTAHLIVTGYGGAPEDLLFVAVDWLHRECVDAAEDAIRFHVDVIDHKSVDVSLAIDISEIVASTDAPDGLRLAPRPDPDALGLDMAALFPNLPAGPDLPNGP